MRELFKQHRQLFEEGAPAAAAGDEAAATPSTANSADSQSRSANTLNATVQPGDKSKSNLRSPHTAAGSASGVSGGSGGFSSNFAADDLDGFDDADDEDDDADDDGFDSEPSATDARSPSKTLPGFSFAPPPMPQQPQWLPSFGSPATAATPPASFASGAGTTTPLKSRYTPTASPAYTPVSATGDARRIASNWPPTSASSATSALSPIHI